MSKECLRMCLGCRSRKPKNKLRRFVIINEEITEDKTQKYNARGFYLCQDEECSKKILKNKALSRKLNRCLTENEVDIIISSKN